MQQSQCCLQAVDEFMSRLSQLSGITQLKLHFSASFCKPLGILTPCLDRVECLRGLEELELDFPDEILDLNRYSSRLFLLLSLMYCVWVSPCLGKPIVATAHESAGNSSSSQGAPEHVCKEIVGNTSEACTWRAVPKECFASGFERFCCQ